MWTVDRHGGRGSDSWRIVHRGDDEKKARDKFKVFSDNLRQGGVVLTKDGKVIDSVYAYRNRTRW